MPLNLNSTDLVEARLRALKIATDSCVEQYRIRVQDHPTIPPPTAVDIAERLDVFMEKVLA